MPMAGAQAVLPGGLSITESVPLAGKYASSSAVNDRIGAHPAASSASAISSNRGSDRTPGSCYLRRWCTWRSLIRISR